MYTIARLNTVARAELTSVLSTGANREAIFPIALAYVIAQNLSLPAQEINDANVHYRNSVSFDVEKLLSQFNELIPHDYAKTSELVRSFYMYRVGAVYPKKYPIAFRKGYGVEDFFGLSQVFSDGVLCLIEESSAALTTLVKALNAIHADLVHVDTECEATGFIGG